MNKENKFAQINLPHSLPSKPSSAAAPNTEEGSEEFTLDQLEDAIKILDSFQDMECPLCLEEMDISDLHFKPCPCSYQICRFCWHHINQNLNNKCPACRSQYSEETIQFKSYSPEELLMFQAAKRLRDKRQKLGNETALATVAISTPVQTTVSASTSKVNTTDLSNVRVRQRAQVHIIGFTSKTVNDHSLPSIKTASLFTQFGKITKISMSKRNTPSNPSLHNQMHLYITYRTSQEATACISALDGRSISLDTSGSINPIDSSSPTSESVRLKAAHGTTRYCTNFLRGARCANENCSGAHEWGEEIGVWNSSIPSLPNNATSNSHHPTVVASATSSTIEQKKALPSTVSWASKSHISTASNPSTPTLPAKSVVTSTSSSGGMITLMTGTRGTITFVRPKTTPVPVTPPVADSETTETIPEPTTLVAVEKIEVVPIPEGPKSTDNDPEPFLEPSLELSEEDSSEDEDVHSESDKKGSPEKVAQPALPLHPPPGLSVPPGLDLSVPPGLFTPPGLGPKSLPSLAELVTEPVKQKPSTSLKEQELGFGGDGFFFSLDKHAEDELQEREEEPIALDEGVLEPVPISILPAISNIPGILKRGYSGSFDPFADTSRPGFSVPSSSTPELPPGLGLPSNGPPGLGPVIGEQGGWPKMSSDTPKGSRFGFARRDSSGITSQPFNSFNGNGWEESRLNLPMYSPGVPMHSSNGRETPSVPPGLSQGVRSATPIGLGHTNGSASSASQALNALLGIGNGGMSQTNTGSSAGHTLNQPSINKGRVLGPDELMAFLEGSGRGPSRDNQQHTRYNNEPPVGLGRKQNKMDVPSFFSDPAILQTGGFNVRSSISTPSNGISAPILNNPPSTQKNFFAPPGMGVNGMGMMSANHNSNHSNINLNNMNSGYINHLNMQNMHNHSPINNMNMVGLGMGMGNLSLHSGASQQPMPINQMGINAMHLSMMGMFQGHQNHQQGGGGMYRS